ncbi:bifunctional acetate--CoA ligase family protein/GNAT family N-acetyltransferase [Polynucleobacter sp. MWH-UH35A]|uniref:bifunctional acetate--CoA ligase family protein/GNAT family N-acetyltransferase n=1 Tax=Polynucleobacter sp. MWH-UH35A TaxID=1855619 RepID=UPI001BFD9B9F|nr:bifunctional acetate--CoA ligase family protein/GNAT family N-acetyltransferase [Polynucleobacter sp. MWH-UH35A]QWD59523.1 bifunctional acetate--CoA ligase family protein/GNAT family N-acetyltransferase [Polynucleobacter sp. MWH-UH35A]
MEKHYLNSLFDPRSISIFVNGKTPQESIPYLEILLKLFEEASYAGEVERIDIAVPIDFNKNDLKKKGLAIIALPATELITALDLAGRLKHESAVIISTGIDIPTSNQLKELAKHYSIKLLGPNTMGFQRPHLHLNASVLGDLASPGPLALIAQSGALTSAMLDWAKTNGVGFSFVASIGQNAAVDIAELLDFLGNDGKTHSIVLYLEGITNSRKFMSALRAAANIKPVIVLKSGHKPAGNEAAKTHCGSIVGSDAVFDAAIRRAGAVRVKSFVDLFSAAKCLASSYRPVGNRLAIITNGGGPGVLAADRVSENNLELAKLSTESNDKLRPLLSPLASLENLIDLSEEATAEQYCNAIEIANSDKYVDGILVIYSPKPSINSLTIANAIADIKKQVNKPLLSCWIGDSSVVESRLNLSNANIPTFRTPEAAVGAFANISSFYTNQKLLQQTPPPLSKSNSPDIEGAKLIIENVLASRRTVLTEMESKSLLSAFHIPITQTILAKSANEAIMIANQIDYPVALKIDSPDVSHKSDVNGVALDVMNALGVRDIFSHMTQTVSHLLPDAKINGITVQKMVRNKRGREIYIGLVNEEPFGPVIAFGAGGTMIELLNDQSMELPPLNQYLAQQLIKRSRIAQTLEEWRGTPPANIEAIEHILMRVSEMACELPQIIEMDINPIIVDEFGAIAVDARIVVSNSYQLNNSQSGIYNHLAILPYPHQYEQMYPLKDGGEYQIRPIHPDDAQMLKAFYKTLSDETRYFRFISNAPELPPSMAAKFTLIDYDREMALVAIVKEAEIEKNGTWVETEKIIGVSRYSTNPDKSSCEFSLVVTDDFGGQGIGSRLMLNIMDVARDKGLSEIDGLVLSKNPGMLKLMRSLGFSVENMIDDPDFKIVRKKL